MEYNTFKITQYTIKCTEMSTVHQYLIVLLSVTLLKSFSIAVVCYKCNSTSLESCAMSLDQTVNSTTYRGCSDDTPSDGATYMKTCTENLCNKGVFPPGRLKCFHCSGTGCVVKPEGKPRPCRHHHEFDSCYTEIIDAREAYRGCSSDTNRTIIGETITCDVNGCNNEAIVSTLKCAQCDSENRRGCKMDLFEVNSNNCNITHYDICEVESFLTRKATCFTYHNLSHVVRGCSKNITYRFDQLSDGNYFECTNDFCNSNCIEQQKCLICDSTTKEACRTNTPQLTSSTCPSAESSSCYTCESETWKIQRGCGTPTQKLTEHAHCYECSAYATCNTASFTRCYQCSSAIDNNCATWERPGSGFIVVEECEKQCNITTNSCLACEGNFCNKDPYPANRLRCYQCGATNDPNDDCTYADDDPLACPLAPTEPWNSKQACFEYFSNINQKVVRGCRSNINEYYQCLLQSTSCYLCSEDGCNKNINEIVKNVKQPTMKINEL